MVGVQVPLCEQTWRLQVHLSGCSLGATHLVFETGSLTLVLDRSSALESMRLLNTDMAEVRFEARHIDDKAGVLNHSALSKAICELSLYSIKGWGRGIGGSYAFITSGHDENIWTLGTALQAACSYSMGSSRDLHASLIA